MQRQTRSSLKRKRLTQEPEKSSDTISSYKEYEDGIESDASENQKKSRKKARKVKPSDVIKSKTKAKNETTDKVIIARPDRPNVRGQRGLLEFINNMPVEMLYNVFNHLDPLDLLYLSWSCKKLHSIVMDKDSIKTIWGAAFERAFSSDNRPPPCPPDLNFAQYARFLYVKKCMLCETATAPYSSWFCRLKACWKCLNTNYFKRRKYLFVVDENDEYRISRICRIDARGYRFFPRVELESLIKSTKSVQDVINRETHRAHYESWMEHMERARQAEKDEKQYMRQERIFEKLNELGWKTDDIYHYARNHGTDLPTFYSTVELTDREWKKLYPKILEKLEEGKERQIRLNSANKTTVLRSFINCWTPHPMSSGFRFKAPVSEFLGYEPFASVISDPNQTEPTLNTEAIIRLDNINAECFQLRNRVLFNFLPEKVRSINVQLGIEDPYQILQLAAIWFEELDTGYYTGNNTKELWSYTQMLQNVETTYWRRELEKLEDQSNVIRFSHFVFDQRAHQLAENLVRSCGMNPKTTTAEMMDLDVDNVRLSCTVCKGFQPNRPGYHLTWRSAINHASVEHSDLVSQKDIFQVKRIR